MRRSTGRWSGWKFRSSSPRATTIPTGSAASGPWSSGRERLSGVTKLIIAQRINSVMDADKIIVLDNGKIVGFGAHSQLISECKEYQEIYYSQKDREE